MRRNWITPRMEGTWVIRYYQVGYTAEKIKYRISGAIAGNREKTRREIARQDRKPGQGIRQIQRTVNANFYRSGGYLLELTYSDAALERLSSAAPDGDITQAAQHEMELWMRRVRRERKKTDGQFKYWGITSAMDGRTGETARVHHHVIIDIDSLAECIGKWPYGTVEFKRLWDEPDHNDLVAYLLRQVSAGKNAKRYTPSRNLIHPKPLREITCHTDAELRLPRGCSLIHRAENSRFEPQYIRYILPAGYATPDEDLDGGGTARRAEAGDCACSGSNGG